MERASKRPALRGLLTRLPLLVAAMAVLTYGCDRTKEAALSKVVIRVGESKVTIGQYRQALKRLVPDESQLAKTELDEIKKELVNQLIEEELILQYAKGVGLSIDEKEVSAEAEGIRKGYDEESFKEAILERYGDVDAWRAEIGRKLLIKKAIDGALGQKIRLTDAEARAYYKAHAKEFETKEMVRARMIVLSSEDEARELRAKLKPENFATMAKEKSLSPEAVNGGDLGYFGKQDMPREFEDAVFRLKPFEISPVVKTDYGFHIFFLEERVRAGKQDFESVRQKVVERAAQEKESELLFDWVASLKSGVRIEIKEGLL